MPVLWDCSRFPSPSGGIENLYAVAGAVGLSDENLANVLLLINLIFRPWMTILIVMVPFAARFNKWTGGKPEEIDVIASRLDETKREKQIPTSLDLFMIMGVGLVIVAFEIGRASCRERV